MAYSLELAPGVDETFRKLRRKNKVALQAIGRKLKAVLEDPYRFKALSGPLAGKWRVHIDSSFVLIYRIDEPRKVVEVLEYEHHDKAYR